MRYGIFSFVLGLLLLLLGAPALCADTAPWEAGRFDGQIIDALNAACKALPLHEACLKEVAPQYWVEIDPALTWTDAVRVAAERYPDDQVKRILFMARYLKKGDPISLIEQMNMPGGMVFTVTMGPGTVTNYDIGAVMEENADPRIVAYRLSPIKLSVSHNSKGISECHIRIQTLAVGGITYKYLVFDMDGTLQSFEQHLPLSDAALALVIGGNTSGEGGKHYYYGMVQIGEQHTTIEELNLISTRALAGRRVYRPEGHTPICHEVYTDGKLTKRTWYKALLTVNGIENVIERTESFE